MNRLLAEKYFSRSEHTPEILLLDINIINIIIINIINRIVDSYNNFTALIFIYLEKNLFKRISFEI